MIFKPFFPYTYNGEISEFVSPAFDTIDHDDLEELLNREFNVTQIVVNQNGRTILDEMISRGILKKAKKSVLLLEQHFVHNKQRLSRLGVIGIIDISDKRSILVPHESTIPEYVDFRKRSFDRTRTQTEPVFVAIPDRDFDRILRKYIKGKNPDLSFLEPKGATNRVYVIDTPDTIEVIQRRLRKSEGYIADGHHRVQALRNTNSERALEGKEQFQLLGYVTSLYSESLLINGIHRVVESVGGRGIDKKLGEYFIVSKPMKQLREDRMGIYDGEFREIIPTLLTSNIVLYKGIKDAFWTDYSDLVILHDVLSVDPNETGNGLSYILDQHKAVELVDSQNGRLAIIIPPWDKDSFIKAAKRGRLLSPKSTFFSPKIPAGIALYKMD